jgi:hypothetical protein
LQGWSKGRREEVAFPLVVYDRVEGSSAAVVEREP